jgi:hypothetical protein
LIAKGYSRQLLSHYEKLFEKAGVSSNSIESHKSLPALSVFFEGMEEINDKPLSDTRGIEPTYVKTGG